MAENFFVTEANTRWPEAKEERIEERDAEDYRTWAQLYADLGDSLPAHCRPRQLRARWKMRDAERAKADSAERRGRVERSIGGLFLMSLRLRLSGDRRSHRAQGSGGEWPGRSEPEGSEPAVMTGA